MGVDGIYYHFKIADADLDCSPTSLLRLIFLPYPKMYVVEKLRLK